MEILGYKESEIAEALFKELFSNVLDCNVRLGSDPDTLTRFGVVMAYHRGCDDRRLTRPGRILNHDNSIVVLV